MHDLDRQQLEQYERDVLESLPQPREQAYYEYAETGYEAPVAPASVRVHSGRWVRHGHNIVLFGA